MSGDPFSPLPIRRIEVDPAGERPDRRSWPATIPAVAQLLHEGLDLGAATVLVGENGTGKSTLVEAIAMSYGLGPSGPKVVAVNGSLTSKRMPRTPAIPKPARRSVCIAR